MTTTVVSTANNNTPDNNADITNGNILEVSSTGAVNTTTVESGGTLVVDSGGTDNTATIKTGGIETVNGTATGDDVSGTLNVGQNGSAATGVVNNVTIESGGSVNLTYKGGLVSVATVKTGGLLTINGNAAANSVTLQGGMLDLQSAKADATNASGVSASGNLTFASGYSSTLQLDLLQTGGQSASAPTTFSQTITGFANGDIVDLRAIAYSSTPTLTATQNNDGSSTVKVQIGTSSTAQETFTFANTTATNFALQNDNFAGPYPSGTTSSGTEIVYNTVCFVSGTLISIARGHEIVEIAVEDLAIGDMVVTASGAQRPIKWLGHRTVACGLHPRPAEAMPVRIAAHASGSSKPARDLYVSPGHAICVTMVDEVLIPACSLVNGSTIRQVAVDEVTYWHVELDSHDIILAENLACESYIDMGNRDFFREADVVSLDALPDAALKARTHADFCRPFHSEGPLVDLVRSQLRARSTTLGWTLEHEPLADLHLIVDGERIEPAVRDLGARFSVPAGTRDVWLVSNTSRPSDVDDSVDVRDLGLYLNGLVIDDGFGASRTIDLSDPLLCVGFHALEAGARRWTAGRARIPVALWDDCPEGFFLRVELAGPAVPRWVSSASATPGVPSVVRWDVARGIVVVTIPAAALVAGPLHPWF